MPSAKKTPNYNLTQYADNGTDKVSFMGDYNADMSKIDTALNNNANNIITKADKADTYSKTDVDTKLSAKADSATTYSKTDVDSKLGTKADSATTYSKSDVDGKLGTKADSAATYSKSDVDSKLRDKANVSDVYNKTQSDARYVPTPTGKILLTIGDSYGAGTTDDKWPNGLSKKLTGYALKNFCVSGAGFAVSNNTFIGQAQSAAADGSFDNNDVGIIVVAGGRNDIIDQPTAFSLSSSLCAFLKANFPQAKIYVVPMLWDHTPESGYEREKASGISEGALSQFVQVVPYAWTWNLGNSSNFPSGDIHPNTAGAAVIVNYMVQAILGGYAGRSVHYYAAQDGISGESAASGGHIVYTWGGTNIPNLAKDSNFTIPEWARRGYNVSTVPGSFAVGVSNSGVTTSFVNIADVFAVSGTNMAVPKTVTGGTIGGTATFPW